MKKILSLLVAVMMVSCVAASLAEVIQLDSPIIGYDMIITLPEGVESTIDSSADSTWIRFTYGPNYNLTIARSDLFEGKGIADLSQEERDILAGMLCDHAAAPKYSEITLENDLVVMLVEEETEANDFASMQTIFNGYFITLYVANENYAKLSVDDAENMVEIMQSIVFSPAEAE